MIRSIVAWALAGAVWLGAAWAGAGGLQAVPDGPGRLAIRRDQDLLAIVDIKTPPAARGTPSVREVVVSGHPVIELRVPVAGGKQQEVWLGQAGSGRATPIWTGLAGPRNADDEARIDVTAAADGIEEYQTAARLAGCGGRPIPLFRRIWNFATRHFEAAPPLPRPPEGPAVQVHRAGADMPAGIPRGDFHWTGASSTVAASGDARALTAPLELDDGDPQTVWKEGVAGDGRGEQLTARAGTSHLVTGLRVLPGDTSSKAAFRASNRPRHLTVTLGAARPLEIELVDDTDGGVARYRQPFWIAVSPAVPAACVSVTVRDVTPGTGARGSNVTAVGDIAVFTEIDRQDGLPQLIAQVAGAASCEAMVPVLAGMGRPAVEPVAAALAATRGPGRECLLQALERLVALPAADDGSAATAINSGLLAAIPGASRTEEKAVAVILGHLSAPPIDELGALIANPTAPDSDRTRAARLLATLAAPVARAALVAAAGAGPSPVRVTVREQLCATKGPGADTLLAALARTPADATGRRADLILCLGSVAPRDTTEGAAVRGSLGRALGADNPFEVRARSIEALGQLHDPATVDELARVLRQGDDAVLRFFAARELSGAPGSAAAGALRAAISDADPRVRETASLGLGRQGDKGAADILIAGAKQEPWPFVRRAEIVALGQLCGEPATDLMVRANERDTDDVRRAALAGLVQCRDRRAAASLLRVLGRRAEAASLRELAARLLGRLRDPATAAEMAAIVQRLLVESQPDLALEGVTITTTRALAALGGRQAVQTARAVLNDPRPSLKRGAIDALGLMCDDQDAATILRDVGAGSDPGLADTAAAALRHCAKGR